MSAPHSQSIKASHHQDPLGLDASPGMSPSDLARDSFPKSRRSLHWLIFAAVLFGLLCRLSQYAAHTSLWHDEAFLALNVLNKNFTELLGPLEWYEASPPGFLVVEKLLVSWLGRSEYVFRLVPLLTDWRR